MGDKVKVKMEWVPEPPARNGVPPVARPGTWNIMVYLDGDNNLSEEMIYAVKSMFSAGSSDTYRIYAFYDAGLDPVPFRIPTRKERDQALVAADIRVEDVEEHVTENHHLFRLA